MLTKKALVAIAAIGVGASASTATAQLSLYGSDTMFEVTTKIINDCVSAGSLPANSLVYRGTGSGQGGKAMNAGDSTVTPAIPAQNQQIAAQSRFLNSSECGAPLFPANAGQGINVGLDAISVVADNVAPTNSCNTLRYSGALAGFNFDNWQDVLRVVYTGQSAKVTLDACSASDPARTPSAPGNIIGRCNSTLRTQLIGTWGNMFEGGCTNGKCPNGLRHAWRRDDVSGTTDTFLTLLGLPAATTRTFCNGFDTEDLDPVRRDCDANEQVCSNIKYALRNASPEGALPPATASTAPTARGGDLGLVQAITLPTDVTLQYNATACFPGRFGRAPMSTTVGQGQTCPDGTKWRLGQCAWPTTSAGAFNCRAIATTVPPVALWPLMDGRAYNLVPRNAAGAILITPTGVPDPRWGGGGVYRIHQTAAMTGGSGTCTRDNATQQIGCLVQSDPCSLGYAGREAAAVGSAKALNLGSPAAPIIAVAPTDANVRLLLDPTGAPCNVGAGDNFGNRYPLARKLWFTASKGFGNFTTFPNISNTTFNGVTSNENLLMQCIANRGNNITDTALTTFNFVTVPAGAYPNRTCP